MTDANHVAWPGSTPDTKKAADKIHSLISLGRYARLAEPRDVSAYQPCFALKRGSVLLIT